MKRELGENSEHSQPVLSTISKRNNNSDPLPSVPSARSKQKLGNQLLLKCILSEFFSISYIGCKSYNLADTVLDRNTNIDMGILS